METAAAAAPAAPASSATWPLFADSATPKTSPKTETVLSFIPKTMSPREGRSDLSGEAELMKKFGWAQN